MAASNFIFDTRELKFLVKEWLDMDKIFSFEHYREYYSKDDFDAFLDVAYKIARDVMAPLNEDADQIGVKFEDGKVITPDSFKAAYQTCIEAELGPQISDREVEGHLPKTMYMPLLEMLISANAAVPLYWNLTAGAAEVAQKFGTEEQKNKFFYKMASGEWGGTMNLTEPGAGSDLGATQTKAFPTDKPGEYKIKGNKIFITSGDHDICENIVHLVLARVEGAREGTAGLSLFLVPKYRVKDDGSIGEFNDVTTVGIEHKMGQHGSATAALSYGENNDCIGYLLGNPPDEKGKGQGMAQMFNMMNEERLLTGLAATAVASQAYFNSLDYSRQRVQGTLMTDPKGPRVNIAEHEDVKRMLLRQKACTEVSRAIIMKTLWYVDVSHESPDADERTYAEMMFQVNNPLCKAYPTEMAWPLIAEAIQVYGGYGYVEEYPVAQLARDVKIYSIWEGTTYVQSLDLVGRKFTMGKGQPFMKWMEEIAQFIEANNATAGFEAEFTMLGRAFAAFQDIVKNLQGYLADGKIRMMPLYATRILQATAMIYGSKLIMEQALLADSKLKEIGEEHFDTNFYKGKIASARFYVMNELTQIFAIKETFISGDATAAIISQDILG